MSGTLTGGKKAAATNKERYGKKAICVKARNKQEGGAKHCKIPVIDSAGRTAFVFHKPRLEGTEKQDADHVADRIKAAQKKHDPVVKQSCRIQKPEDHIEADPNQRNEHCCIVIGNLYICTA